MSDVDVVRVHGVKVPRGATTTRLEHEPCELEEFSALFMSGVLLLRCSVCGALYAPIEQEKKDDG